MILEFEKKKLGFTELGDFVVFIFCLVLEVSEGV